MSTQIRRRPYFSVVVPTYDRPKQLGACLEGLAALNVSRDRLEVIVSDDGSPRPVDPVIAPFRDRLRVVLVTHPNTGPAGARNRGAARAQGVYLAFIDDDCVPTPDWLGALERQFARTPDHLVGGGIVNALPDNPFSTATQLITTYVYDYEERQVGARHFFSTSNIAMPAAQFRELGGFSEAFPLAGGEDYDFCHRWQHAGYRTTYAPQAAVLHMHALTLGGFWRQHYGYGRGLFRYRLRISHRTGQRLKGHATSFYINLLLFPFAQDRGARSLLAALLVALSQLATAAGVLRETMSGGWKQSSPEHAVKRHISPNPVSRSVGPSQQ